LPGGLLTSLFPIERRQIRHLLIGRRGQALQEVFEILERFNAVQTAVLY
jgi:hypothetical protein